MRISDWSSDGALPISVQMAERILPQVEGGPWQSAETRALVIARTETKYAQNISTIERGRAAGVTSFIVFDGRLGPGRSKPDHIERDGSIVSTVEAVAMAGAGHPNGTKEEGHTSEHQSQLRL